IAAVALTGGRRLPRSGPRRNPQEMPLSAHVHFASAVAPSFARAAGMGLCVLAPALVCMLAGCRDPSPRADPRVEADASSAGVLATELGSRAEVVVRADRLALEGSRATPARARELLDAAATLRERLYRRERRQVDALEALEHLRTLEALPGDKSCDVALRRALLEGELRRDPVETYQQVYALRFQSNQAACRQRADRALLALAAYRPLPNVLAELEQRAAHATPSATLPELAVSGAPPQPTTRVGPVRITQVERYGSTDAARVVVHVTHPAAFHLGQADSNGAEPRLFVDIDGAAYAGPSSIAMTGLVEGVRIGQRPTGARVVLDLARSAEHRAFYLPEPLRLVIDVFTPRPDPPSAAAGRRVLRRVVLDPGHGGNDPGATGPSGLREKDVALDIAHRAAPLIARELGIATLLTRDGDHYVPLDERTARANAFHADLFVSIHCNASEDTGARGVMTFVLDQSQEEVAQRIAARENAASAAAAAELANALARVAAPANVRASLHFAELLQRSAMASLADAYPEIPNGGVKRAGFYVLAGARMPAVLFETSFISNTGGELRLNTGDFRQKMADAVVNALRAYRDGL
ncbi:MAG TPA: N-acetylmuramoyl-L-alanine amidase, partial [Polyangiaceae bacterium]|nr:N-acetylmuramoyl-L-alanine amidase [Polyangiaceae bacterium]